MYESTVIFLKSTAGGIASFIGGGALSFAITVQGFEIEQGVLYGFLTAILWGVWRAACFAKGVNDSLKDAKTDRDKHGKAIERLEHKFKNLDKAFALMADRCPASRGDVESSMLCRPRNQTEQD